MINQHIIFNVIKRGLNDPKNKYSIIKLKSFIVDINMMNKV